MAPQNIGKIRSIQKDEAEAERSGIELEDMSDYHVIIPPENYKLVNFRQNDMPGVAVINWALRKFEPKIVSHGIYQSC